MGRIQNWMRPIAVHSELDNFLIIVVIWDGGGTPCMTT